MPWPALTRPRWFWRDYPLTTACLVVQLAFYALLPDGGIRWGAISRVPLWSGEWWRLLTPMLIHADRLHLTYNAVSTFFLLPALEDHVGTKVAAGVYVAGGLGGALFSVLGQDVLSVGASGAIFGVIGCLGALALHRSGTWSRMSGDPLGFEMLIWTLLGIGLNMTNTRVDNLAHLGGLVIGGCLGEALFSTPRGGRWGRGVLAATLVALALGSVAACVSPWQPQFHLVRAERLDSAEAQIARLRKGLYWGPRSASLHWKLAELEYGRGNVKAALEHRVFAIEGGLTSPQDAAAQAYLAVAGELAVVGEAARAAELVGRIDVVALGDGEVMAGLGLLLAGAQLERAQTWARLRSERSPGGPLEPLLRALLEVERAPESARAAAQSFLGRPPGNIPPALRGWLETHVLSRPR